MKIQIRFKGIKPAHRHPDYVRRRLMFALDRFSTLIDSVFVRIEDVNGPRGGVDQKCGILVKMRQGGNLWMDGMEEGWRAAVDHVSHRMGEAVARLLQSRRALRFESGFVPKTHLNRF